MNKIARNIVLTCSLVLTLGACDVTDLDSHLNNPSVPTPEQADPNLYLNTVQIYFRDFFIENSNIGMRLTRQTPVQAFTYETAYDPTSFDNSWAYGYSRVIQNANALISLADGRKLTTHAGIARILKAYTLIALVDNYGDVPYSEAMTGADNTNPKVDSGKEVYTKAIALLTEGIANLSAAQPASAAPATDVFYNGSRTLWTTLAKTIQLKAYLNMARTDASALTAAKALVTGADLIDTAAEDFVFAYGTKDAAPDSRSPRFVTNYQTNTKEYISSYALWALYQEKGLQDPRLRYYFYRQSKDASVTNSSNLSCILETAPAHYAGQPFCYVGAGYWGRDHGDGSGIPPDGTLRTLFGLYPFGGAYDALTPSGTAVAATVTMGAKGAGMEPILLSSFTEFMKAEIALLGNDNSAAKTALEKGIRASIAKVQGFQTSVIPSTATATIPTTTAVDAYVTKVLGLFESGDKKDVVGKEFWIASFGNGQEAYNLYRRTGSPANLQPMKLTNFGKFYRSCTYPNNYVSRNKNAAQKASNDVKVFWDNGSTVLK